MVVDVEFLNLIRCVDSMLCLLVLVMSICWFRLV